MAAICLAQLLPSLPALRWGRCPAPVLRVTALWGLEPGHAIEALLVGKTHKPTAFLP